MIKIGTSKDLYKISHLPYNVKLAIQDDIKALDCFYGRDRDIDADFGGFVIVCEKDEDVDIENFKKEFEAPEFVQEICPYTKSLYISGTERNIIIYEKR